ncbi:hypothetical protein [Acinetobacter indicus]|uniref:hypothetical protein n=1 Tax=Acinetobacter indicus TaxID=756892 RepID=UPI000CEB9BEA|nr:hypothetical protein [Acinetobacter indicus]
MNLYIVESPLQLLCAYEAIQIEDQNEYYLLIRQTGRGSNDQHLLTCAKKLGLTYDLITIRTDRVIFDLLKNIFFLIKILSKSYNKTYFGSYYSSFLKLIRKFSRQKEIFYLDDGAATLRAQQEIVQSNSIRVNWFTFFEIQAIEGQDIVHHNFNNLRDKVIKKKKEGHFFIGQPVEHMIGYSVEDYINCVSFAAQQCIESGPLIYIPHRVENIKHIAKIENLKILYLNMPVELYFLLEARNFPKRVYSCYSTALFSLSKILYKVDIYALYYRQINSKEIKVVYEGMNEIGVQVVQVK